MNFRVLYFASLRDKADCDAEDVASAAVDANALYAQLRERHGFIMPRESLRVAINGEFSTWDRALNEGDEVVFIPPVSGG